MDILILKSNDIIHRYEFHFVFFFRILDIEVFKCFKYRNKKLHVISFCQHKNIKCHPLYVYYGYILMEIINNIRILPVNILFIFISFFFYRSLFCDQT